MAHGIRPWAAGLAALAMWSATGALAEDFYQGRTLVVVNPSDPGGSYHLYAEIVARNIAKHIPGKPTAIVQDKPGAGGAVGAAYMMNAAPQDGTAIAQIAPGTITDPLIRQLKYDATKFHWLGSIASRSQVIAVWDSVPVKSIDDMKKTEVTMGASGRGAASYVVPAYVNAMLGTKMKIITGYKGGGDLDLAMERGEIQGRSNYYSGFTSIKPEWVRDKKIKFLVVVGAPVPELPQVPNVRQFLKPGSVEAKVDALISLNFEIGQGFYAPPGTPPDRVDILRKAFAAMLADPATREECEKRKLDFTDIRGAHVQKLMEDGFKSANGAVLAKFREVMGADRKS